MRAHAQPGELSAGVRRLLPPPLARLLPALQALPRPHLRRGVRSGRRPQGRPIFTCHTTRHCHRSNIIALTGPLKRSSVTYTLLLGHNLTNHSHDFTIYNQISLFHNHNDHNTHLLEKLKVETGNSGNWSMSFILKLDLERTTSTRDVNPSAG